MSWQNEYSAFTLLIAVAYLLLIITIDSVIDIVLVIVSFYFP